MAKKKAAVNKKKMRSRKTQQSSPFDFIESKVFSFAAIVFFVIAGFTLYQKTLDYPFQFDDIPLVKNNTTLTKPYPEFHILTEYPMRFVSFYSFYLNYDQDGPQPEDFRFWNIIIHILNTILVFILIPLILKTPGLNNKFNVKTRYLAAFVVALVFLVHPMQTQAVVYIYQRLASIVSLFYLLSVVFYLSARLSKKRLFKLLFFLLTAGSAFLAMLSKENSFSLPVMLVFLELLLFKASLRSSWKIILSALLFGALGLYLFFYFDVQTKLLYTRYYYTGEMLTSWKYFLTQWTVLIEYMRMLLLPYGQNVDHQYLLSQSIFDIKAILSGLFHIGMFTLAVVFFRKHKLVTLGIVWFYVTISIESTFIPIRDVLFEHRVYLPMTGFFAAITGLLHYYLKDNNFIKYVPAAFIVFAAAMAMVTLNRLEIWSDPVELWTDTIKKSPDKVRPYNNRGDTYFRKGQYDLALRDFNHAVENLQPTIKNLQDFEAPRWYLDEIAGPIKNRGLVKYHMGRMNEAIEDFTAYREINYKDHSIFNDRANAYKNLKKYEKAAQDYTKFLNKTPKTFEYYDVIIKNRGACYMHLGQYKKAVKDFNAAISIDPEQKQHYLLRAYTYYKTGQYRKARKDYKKILELDPDSEDAKKNIKVINNLLAK